MDEKSYSIKEKIALVTGGLGGLGTAFTGALLKSGVKVVYVVDLANDGQNDVEKLCAEFPESRVVYKKCDVTNYDDFKDVFQMIKKESGYIDIVVNNAGIYSADDNVERCQRLIQVNLTAVYYGTWLAQQLMDKNKDGRGGVVINVASAAAFVPTPIISMAYAASKSGVVALTRTAGLTMYKDATGVRVNAICPSFVDTPLLDGENAPKDIREEAASLGFTIMSADMTADGVIQLIEDESKSGAVVTVTHSDGIQYVNFENMSGK